MNQFLSQIYKNDQQVFHLINTLISPIFIIGTMIVGNARLLSDIRSLCFTMGLGAGITSIYAAGKMMCHL